MTRTERSELFRLIDDESILELFMLSQSWYERSAERQRAVRCPDAAPTDPDLSASQKIT